MARKVIAQRECWWVWLGEEPAVRVDTEEEAVFLMCSQGHDYGIPNKHGRRDCACSVLEVIWDEPLPEDKDYHTSVISPIYMVLRKGHLRKFIHPKPPSKLRPIVKSWSSPVSNGFPAWWPDQYFSAINDPRVLKVRGKKVRIEDQLDKLWEKPSEWLIFKKSKQP